MCRSRSIKVTTHFPTDTSVPTYIKSAIARSKNEGLRKRAGASPIGDDSGCVGLGKREARISTSKIAAAPPSDEKINPSPPRCCNLWTTRGSEASPRPKHMSSKLSAALRQPDATSATSAWPAATIAFAPKPSINEQAKISSSADAACTLVTVRKKPAIEATTMAVPNKSANFFPMRSMIGPLTAYARTAPTALINRKVATALSFGKYWFRSRVGSTEPGSAASNP